MAKLIVLVGLPGSGKSSYANNVLLEADKNTVLHSSDNIRQELFGDASSQENNALVFETMHKRVKEDLRNGKTVVYDATNVTRKSRRGAINLASKEDELECHVVWAPVNECINRDRTRSRTVGKQVIDKFLRRWQSPFYDEGFDTIKIIPNVIDHDHVRYARNLTISMNIPHDNPHHTLNVLEHCEQAYENIKDKYIMPYSVYMATLWHDVGKPYTKGYKNKPDSDEIDYSVAHYYDHQNVGAYMSYGLYVSLMEDDWVAEFSWLINNHMEPFFNSKYYKDLPQKLKEYIDAIHDADRSAH